MYHSLTGVDFTCLRYDTASTAFTSDAQPGLDLCYRSLLTALSQREW